MWKLAIAVMCNFGLYQLSSNIGVFDIYGVAKEVGTPRAFTQKIHLVFQQQENLLQIWVDDNFQYKFRMHFFICYVFASHIFSWGEHWTWTISECNCPVFIQQIQSKTFHLRTFSFVVLPIKSEVNAFSLLKLRWVQI